MDFTGQLGTPESQLGHLELGVVSDVRTLIVPPAVGTASIPTPELRISVSRTAPPATATASTPAPAVSLTVGPFAATATGSLLAPALVSPHVIPAVDVPTTLTLKPRATGLTHFRASSLLLAEHPTSLGLMAPTTIEVYALSRTLALALHLSTLELEQPSTLVLADLEKELVLDG